MEHGQVFKQQFKKSITLGTVFQTVLYAFIASWFGDKVLPFLLDLNIERIDSIKEITALILILILFLLFAFASLCLIFCNNYVIVYDDRLVCKNRFIPIISRTFHFEKYKNHLIVIYVRNPHPGMGSAFNYVKFFKPYRETRNAGPVAIGKENCLELAEKLEAKGLKVKIYN